MKNIVILTAISMIFLLGCSTKKLITMDSLLQQKILMDNSNNPAKRLLVKKNLLTKRIKLHNVLVKDIIESSNIDYDFTVIVEHVIKKKKVEFYIYTKNLSMVARLEKGKSRIDFSGEFSRFFTMLDEYYTKVDVVNARITFHKEEKKKKRKK